MKKVPLLGIEVASCSSSELTEYVCATVAQGRRAKILNVNVHCMNLAWRLPWLRKMLSEAAIVFCDGDGVRVGARIAGKYIREKITYNRWIWEMAAASEAHGITWYIVGGTDTAVGEAVAVFRRRFQRLRIAGFRSGYFNGEADTKATLEHIRGLKPDLLVLGMGMPLQERWLEDNWQELSVKVALTGGAVLDYVSGRARMTPHWAYALKLEWLYRLIQEPRRLFRRYVLGNPLFMARVILHEVAGVRLPWESETKVAETE